MKLPTYKREFCCTECGLIWFAETTIANAITCPECGNNNRKGLIYACDTMGFAYASEQIKNELKQKGKSIHHNKEHTKHQKEYIGNLIR